MTGDHHHDHDHDHDRDHDRAGAGAPGSAARNVPALLLALSAEGFTGSVALASTPGGTIHLEHGLVTAVDTPAAPGPQTLLLKSGRITEADWRAAAAALPAGPAADLGALLVARGAIGAAELEAVCASAVFDGAFALVLARPGEWRIAAADAPAPLALRPGVEPRRMFEETARRTALLTALGGPPAARARLRPRPASPAPAAAGRLPARQRELLAAATGRRTARDLGFALGRGLFAVLLDLARLDARRLLHREAEPPPGVPGVAPRTPPDGPPPAATGPLPRRVPGGRAPAARAPQSPPVPPAGPTRPTERSEKTAP
ncbi:hypothetical protein ACIQBJ_17775 [Kitasatospora sp. NPDC088391]|uniref:hypothetical protein n=1 Tax=Kitasatospora sp. NPDC088391 TaxID=3364074 RepID=UPI00380A037F